MDMTIKNFDLASSKEEALALKTRRFAVSICSPMTSSDDTRTSSVVASASA